MQPHMIVVLRPAKQLEEFHRARRPSGDITRELLQHRRRPLATTVAERIGDARALADDTSGIDREQTTHPHQIADVRHYPFVAGLDEPVLVQTGDILLDNCCLLGYNRDHRLQWLPLLRITYAIDRRQQVVEVVGGYTHCSSSVKRMPSGLTVNSCAALTSLSVQVAIEEPRRWRSVPPSGVMGIVESAM